MDLSTAVIAEKLEQYLSTAYQTLSREYLFFSLAIVMACIVLPVFGIRILGKYERSQAEKEGKPYKAYLFKSTSNLRFHYIIAIVLLVLAIRRLFRSIRLAANSEIYGVGIICCGLLLLLFAILSVISLLKFQSKGLIMTGIFVICFMAYRQYLRLQDANVMLQQAAGDEVIVRYATYPLIDYIVTSSMMMSVWALIFILCAAFYYYKRRFLFTPGKLDMPRCKICGRPISKRSNFCICCGTEVWANPIQQNVIPLDKEKYCKKCGKVLGEFGCLKCGGAKRLGEEYGKAKLKDKWKSIIRGAVFALLLFAVFYIPASRDMTAGLQKGSAEINNVFVERWNQFYAEPGIAYDAEWVAGFESDMKALYIVDSRWYYVNPRAISSNNLGYYGLYTEASMKQMEVLEQMKSLVHSVADGTVNEEFLRAEIERVTDALNQTIVNQARANQYYKVHTLNWDVLDIFEDIFFNGIRYYLQYVNTLNISIVMLFCSFLLLVYLLNSFSHTMVTRLENWSGRSGSRVNTQVGRYIVYPKKSSASLLSRLTVSVKNCGYSFVRLFKELWLLAVRLICCIGLFLSLFGPKNVGKCIRWVKDGLTDAEKMQMPGRHRQFDRKKLITNIVGFMAGIALVVVCALVSRFWGNTDNLATKQQYLQNAGDTVDAYAIDISNMLVEIRNTRTLTEEGRERLYMLIDAQIKADQNLLGYDISGDLEEYAELHAAMRSFCEDDMLAVQSIREAIESGMVPSDELLQNYVSLRAENYRWVLERLAEELMSLAIDQVMDL